MFHLAHISDIHLSPLPKPSIRELASKRLTAYINWQKNRKGELGTDSLDTLMKNIKAMQPDHLAISGDLVNMALDKEFEQARKWLYAQGASRDISLTFGNHDAYIRGSFAKACTIFQPWIKSDEPQIWKSPFPYLRIRNNVAIIGASSAIATPPFFATGYFDHNQSHHLAALLEETKKQNLFRIVTIHHPPLLKATHWHKKLWGIRRFQSIIKHYGAELIIHGHTHLPSKNFIETKDKKIPIIGVASASQAYGGKKTAANFNWFSIEYKNKNWQCNLQRYGIINENNDIAMIEECAL